MSRQTPENDQIEENLSNKPELQRFSVNQYQVHKKEFKG